MLRRLLATVLIGVLFVGALPVLAQEGGKPPEGEMPKEGAPATPAADQAPIKEVADKVVATSKGLREDDLRSAVEAALKRYKDAKPDEKKELLKVLGTSAVTSRWDGVTAYTLKGMAELDAEAALVVEKALDYKSVRKHVESMTAGIETLGTLANPKTADLLVKLLNDKDNAVIAAACKALGGFDKAPESTRKLIVEKLVGLLESAYGSSRDNKNTAAVAKYNAVEQPILASLKNLTGQTFQNSLDWRKWFNDAKKKKWN